MAATTTTDEIKYVIGDATSPKGEVGEFGSSAVMIIHCCNNKGVWGAGFTGAINKKWPHLRPEIKYRFLSVYELGTVNIIRVDKNTFVANIIAQDGYGRDDLCYLDYAALRRGLVYVRGVCKGYKIAVRDKNIKISIHGPRIGAGFAGGDWKVIEVILREELLQKGLPVTIYDLPQ